MRKKLGGSMNRAKAAKSGMKERTELKLGVLGVLAGKRTIRWLAN
jgi:hypothetical protein